MSLDVRVPHLSGAGRKRSGYTSEAPLLSSQWNVFSGSLARHPSANQVTRSEGSAWAHSAVRRSLEFVVAAAALTVMSPLIALIAVVVLVDSGRPIFFRQERMGRMGQPFTLYKFRSMRVDGGQGPCITARGDDRITRAGKFLRRFKLDELPQFWNVLRGEMALVGPRPKLPHLEALLMTYRPGVTGAATIFFRHEEELLAGIPEAEIHSYYEKHIKPAKARLDGRYMRSATFQSDLGILWRTVADCVAPRGRAAQRPNVGRLPLTVLSEEE